MTEEDDIPVSPLANAGLPGTLPRVKKTLLNVGLDPQRLSVNQLGRTAHLGAVPPWLPRLLIGVFLWIVTLVAEHLDVSLPRSGQMALELLLGLVILQASCQALVSATERLSARFRWDHYIAGTFAEILSTTPELVVIAFLIPVSPDMAFLVTVITIYNNALVFSLYSFFLPKDRRGMFVMPTPITKAGTQVLIAGGSIGLILGLVMLTFTASDEPKNSISSLDLVVTSVVLLSIFFVYVYTLLRNYAAEEEEVRAVLEMSEADVEQRIGLVYLNVKPSFFAGIAGLFLVGVAGAFVGGALVSSFAETMLDELRVSNVLTALILAVFAGMSEYVILWQSHRKQEYGIALANAFGGITQVMFLVLPCTLLGIAFYQIQVDGSHPDLPLGFSRSTIFLLIFLFPTFYTLSSLLEEDHTLGLLDTTIMTSIILFLIILLVTYGSTLS